MSEIGVYTVEVPEVKSGAPTGRALLKEVRVWTGGARTAKTVLIKNSTGAVEWMDPAFGGPAPAGQPTRQF